MEGRRGGGEGRIKRKAKKEELTRAEDRQRERMREKQKGLKKIHTMMGKKGRAGEEEQLARKQETCLRNVATKKFLKRQS